VASLDLARQCLDNRLVGTDGTPLGRVDGILLEQDDADTPPRVIAIEVGAVTRARRFHPRLARWVDAMVRRMRGLPTGPWRIEWASVHFEGRDCRVPMDAATSPLRATERYARDHIVEHIPGG
jgi:hypothetical protein